MDDDRNRILKRNKSGNVIQPNVKLIYMMLSVGGHDWKCADSLPYIDHNICGYT